MEEKKDESVHENKEHHEHKVHHENKEQMKIKKSSVWMIASSVLAVLLIISIATSGFGGAASGYFAGKSKDSLIFMSSDACTTACDQMKPVAKEMAEKAGLRFSEVKYSQPVPIPGCTIIKDDVLTIFGINDEESFVQQVCTTTGNEEVCKDAEKTKAKAEKETSKTAEQKCLDMPKADKPKLEVFYVSRCPFGVQSINALYYVAKNFGDKVEVVPRLLVDKSADGKSTTSMHGAEEHVEDLRQICIQKEQPEAYWDYIHCYAESGDSAACEKTAKVDSAKLSKCDGEKYALKEADDWANIYRPKGGSGSPSFFLNGEKINEYDFSQNGRAPDNIKNILCCSMKTKGAECDAQLATAQPPRGFGKIDTSAAASASSGQQLNCG